MSMLQLLIEWLKFFSDLSLISDHASGFVGKKVNLLLFLACSTRVFTLGLSENVQGFLSEAMWSSSWSASRDLSSIHICISGLSLTKLIFLFFFCRAAACVCTWTWNTLFLLLVRLIRCVQKWLTASAPCVILRCRATFWSLPCANTCNRCCWRLSTHTPVCIEHTRCSHVRQWSTCRLCQSEDVLSP